MGNSKPEAIGYSDWLRVSWHIDHAPLKGLVTAAKVDPPRVGEDPADVVEFWPIGDLIVPWRHANMLLGQLPASEIVAQLKQWKVSQQFVDELLGLEVLVRLSTLPAMKMAAPRRDFADLPIALSAAGYDPRAALFYPDLAGPTGSLAIATMLAARHELLKGKWVDASAYLLHAASQAEFVAAHGLNDFTARSLSGPVGVAYRHRGHGLFQDVLADVNGTTRWHKLVSAAANVASVHTECAPTVRPATATLYRAHRHVHRLRSQLAPDEVNAHEHSAL